MSSTHPGKPILFFFYCLLALTAIGTSIAHVHQTYAALQREKK